jgi:hypothetical protein
MQFARRTMGDDVNRLDRAVPIECVGDLPERIAFVIEQKGSGARGKTRRQPDKIRNVAIDEDELPHGGNA